MHNLPLEEVGFSGTRGNVARYVFNSTYVGGMTLLQIEKTFVVKLQLMGLGMDLDFCARCLLLCICIGRILDSATGRGVRILACGGRGPDSADFGAEYDC